MTSLRYVTENTAALILTDVNRRYLTGFASSLGYLLLTNTGNTLFVDGRYFEAACKQVSSAKVELMGKIYDQINGRLTTLGVKKVLIETEVSYATYAELKQKLSVKVSPSSALSDRLQVIRSIKRRDEVNCIISAQRIAEKAFDDVLCFIKEGVTEKQVASLLEYKMKQYGADGVAFDTIAVSGKNSSLPHGVPSDKPIEKGDFVTMDFGATVNGYRSDMTRTVAVGHATDKMTEVYETVLKAGQAVIDGITAGMLCSDADRRARDVIEKAGFGEFFSHSTGHGVGLEVHEVPRLSSACDAKLRAGQIVTDEPGIYIPGEFGVRIEDMLYVRKNGCKNLTKAPKHLIIL